MNTYDKIYINGKWVASSENKTILIMNPFTEDICGQVPAGTREDAAHAVQSARAAFDTWKTIPTKERAHFIDRIADKLSERKKEIAQMICDELGMPIKLSNAVQVGLPIGVMRSYAELAQAVEHEEQIGNSLIVHEPIGVCGLISPWNYPLHQLVGKVAPALAAGCTMVVKPSSETPLNAFMLAEIIDEIGVPAGVFNLVSGSGRVMGEVLCGHNEVDMISFTGSTAVGTRISEMASKTIKRVALELGGKSANIILDDADLKTAVKRGVKDICLNSGQACIALSRMLVPEDRQDEVINIAKKAAGKIVVGDPNDPASFMGPVVSAEQRKTIRHYIRKGIEQGATLITGGEEPPKGFDKGYFVQPSIFADVTNDMTIAQEEIFGPVLCIIPYKDEAEALKIANDSVYGLSGAVWSQDVERAKKVAFQMRTGQVYINGGAFNINAPFGGYKQSGNGRELGKAGLEEFLEIKSIQF